MPDFNFPQLSSGGRYDKDEKEQDAKMMKKYEACLDQIVIGAQRLRAGMLKSGGSINRYDTPPDGPNVTAECLALAFRVWDKTYVPTVYVQPMRTEYIDGTENAGGIVAPFDSTEEDK